MSKKCKLQAKKETPDYPFPSPNVMNPVKRTSPMRIVCVQSLNIPFHNSPNIILDNNLKIAQKSSSQTLLGPKEYSGGQAGDVIAALIEDVGEDGVLSGWDLLGQINRLGDGDLALLNGALELNVLHLLAEVGLGVDEADVAVFDLQHHVCAIYDVFFHCSGCFDDESGTGLRWVRRQGNLFDIDDVVTTVGIAVLEGVLAGNIQRIPQSSALPVSAEDIEGAGARRRSESDNGRREPHVFGFGDGDGDGDGDGGDSWDAGELRSHNNRLRPASCNCNRVG